MSEDGRQRQLTLWLRQVRGEAVSPPEAIFADASFRRYFRYHLGNRTEVAMDAPPPQEDCRPFVAITRAYQEAGLPVPSILAEDLQQGFLALEDLGDTHAYQVFSGNDPEPWYRRALALLLPIARVQHTALGPLPPYDRALLARELDIFPQWLLQTHLGLPLGPEWQAQWQALEEVLIENALGQPQVGIHRDFHSRNLMLQAGSLALIDYQGALRGPITYDAVSLLRDCYLKLPEPLLQTLLEAHFEALQAQGMLTSEVSLDQFRRWFDLMGMQRHLKAAGIFARLHHRDGKSGYLADLPRVIGYLIEVGQGYPETQPLAQLLADRVQPALLSKEGKG
ncbi:aminoglycoside phosphotransferase family protein [Ferrimonas gelatinilytica]|uniref:Phosphotransferase n=1 Tax=Ferrimonas gelatinilytica TaxID=1255257 RepID=A0ABP9S1Z9_9GAMM